MFLATIGCVSIALWKPQAVVPAQTAAAPDLQNDVSLQRQCAELFKTILEIQDNREQFRTQLGTIQEAFNKITQNIAQEVVRRNTALPPTDAIKITTMAGCAAVKK